MNEYKITYWMQGITTVQANSAEEAYDLFYELPWAEWKDNISGDDIADVNVEAL